MIKIYSIPENTDAVGDLGQPEGDGLHPEELLPGLLVHQRGQAGVGGKLADTVHLEGRARYNTH